MTSHDKSPPSDLPDIIGQLPANGISVLIVGSGIGGLSAARELKRIGCNVRVLERQPCAVLTGDSFSIGPSALASLRNFPRLEHEIDARSWEPVMYMRKLNGELIKGPVERNNMLSAKAKAALHRNLCRHSRPSMYASMKEHLERIGIPIEHNKEVVDYFGDSDSGRAGVILADGSREEADLVIAADGVHSRSWKAVLGREVLAKPSGDAMFRVSYPLELALKDPVITRAFPQLREGGRSQVNIYAGAGLQLVVAWTPSEMSWSFMHKDDGRARESWDHHPPVEKALSWLDPHPEVPEVVRRVIQNTPSETLVDFRIMWRDPQPQWVSSSGRLIQLGDAAHTFHPHSGNGGTQAIEDAVSLAKCIALAGKDDLEWATRVSNLLRFERVSCLQAFGIYNSFNKKKGGAGGGEMGAWMVAHDPEVYAAEKYEEARGHLQQGTAFKSTNTPPGMIYRPWSLETLVDEVERGEPTVLDGDWS